MWLFIEPCPLTPTVYDRLKMIKSECNSLHAKQKNISNLKNSLKYSFFEKRPRGMIKCLEYENFLIPELALPNSFYKKSANQITI